MTAFISFEHAAAHRAPLRFAVVRVSGEDREELCAHSERAAAYEAAVEIALRLDLPLLDRTAPDPLLN